jgi:hypothetical protein
MSLILSALHVRRVVGLKGTFPYDDVPYPFNFLTTFTEWKRIVKRDMWAGMQQRVMN